MAVNAIMAKFMGDREFLEAFDRDIGRIHDPELIAGFTSIPETPPTVSGFGGGRFVQLHGALGWWDAHGATVSWNVRPVGDSALNCCGLSSFS